MTHKRRLEVEPKKVYYVVVGLSLRTVGTTYAAANKRYAKWGPIRRNCAVKVTKKSFPKGEGK